MVNPDSGLNRRDFLKAGVTVAAAASMMGAAPAAKDIQPGNSAIPTRPFGKTGHVFPILGHGGSAMMEKEYAYYHLENPPTVEDRVKMVRDAYDKGVRYFDTARIYQESEQIMGEALHDIHDKVYLASKVMVGTPEEVRPSVETSLKTLQMDYIDCMQIHGPTIEQIKYEGAMKQYEELVKLREEGLIRFIGITGHGAFDEMYKLISTGNFDSVLIACGYFHRGYKNRHSEAQIEWRNLCIDKAHEVNMGIVAMKVLGAWVMNHNAQNMVPDFDPERLKNLQGAAIRYVMNDPRISILNIGVSYPGDVDKNLATITGDTKFTEADRTLLAEFSAKAYLHPSIQELTVA